MGDWCNLTPDSFSYLTCARTFAETGGFPPYQMTPPPGFAAIIAPLMLLGDTPFWAMRALFSICWALAGVMAYLLHRRELGEGLGWVAGLLVATSPVLFVLTTTPLSESVFITILVAVLLAMNAWWRRPVGHWYEVALGGLLMAAAIMVRLTGLLLLPLLGAALLHHRAQAVGRRALWGGIFLICALGPWAAWQVRQSAYPPGPGYAQNWTAARGAEDTNATGLALQLERFARFGPLRLESIKETVLPKELAWRAFNPPFDGPTTWLVGGFLVVIALVRLVKYRGPIDAFVLLSLLVLALWPWDEGVRLVAPLIPVLVGYPLWAGKMCWQRKGVRRWQRSVLAAALLALLSVHAGGMALVQSRLPARRDKARRHFAGMAALAEWHARNTPEGASWTGIAPDLHGSKLLLMGAAYLSRRPLTTVDVREGMTIRLATTDQGSVFVHESLSRPEGVIAPPGYQLIDTIDEFIVLQATGPPDE
jgi:4-amino-4-deoxy-L-arabinose transferase-like glycosyltransferase